MTREEFLKKYNDVLEDWHETEIKKELLVPAIEKIISELAHEAFSSMNTHEEQRHAAKQQGYWLAILDLAKKA